MKLNEFVGIDHTMQYVIYDGYTGDNQEPVFVARTSSDIKDMIFKYGLREISCLEAIEDCQYIWLHKASYGDRVALLLKNIVDKIRNDEDDDEITRSILLDIGFYNYEIDEFLN